jgi:tRNA (cmo5U34)-methyltransferase
MTQSPAEESWSLADTEVFVKYGDACVPRRAEQIAIVCDLLSDLPAETILDLCCGEGRLSEEYLRRHPASQVTLLDGSAEMLALASERLGRLGASCTQIRADIRDRDWRTGESYGGVMTSLAVHHLDAAGKRELYADLRQMLLPGGVFVMADLVEPTGPVARKLAAEVWQESVGRASRQLFGGDEALAAFIETQWNYYLLPGPDEFDQPSSIAEHLTWLGEAGFEQVDLTWMYAGHAIFTARRPAAG